MNHKQQLGGGTEPIKEEVFTKLKKDFPAVATVTIEYFGGSDSFSEFSSVELATLEGKTPKGLPKRWRKTVLNTTSAYMFSLFDHAGVSFVGGGCNGSFVFDLLKRSVTLTNYSDDHSLNGDFGLFSSDEGEDDDASLEDPNNSDVYVTDRHHILYRHGGESDRKIQGQTFFVAGRLSLVSTDEAKVLLKNAGATVHSRRIAQEITYYVAGRNPGSSLRDAEERGIRVINEVEMLEMVGLHLQPYASDAGYESARDLLESSVANDEDEATSGGTSDRVLDGVYVF